MLFGEEHVRCYTETDGAEGHEWQGTTVLILTTTGQRTGEPRATPPIYRKHGEDYVVVASKGGADSHPAWYLNLLANPEVSVQVLGDKFTARARTARPAEKPELWREITATWPAYDDYQRKTRRQIPLVVLERAEGEAS